MKLRLVCAFAVRKQRSQWFSGRGPYEVEAGLRLCCSQATSQWFVRRGPFDFEAGLRLCCSQATKSGVFASRPF